MKNMNSSKVFPTQISDQSYPTLKSTNLNLLINMEQSDLYQTNFDQHYAAEDMNQYANMGYSNPDQTGFVNLPSTCNQMSHHIANSNQTATCHEPVVSNDNQYSFPSYQLNNFPNHHSASVSSLDDGMFPLFQEEEEVNFMEQDSLDDVMQLIENQTESDATSNARFASAEPAALKRGCGEVSQPITIQRQEIVANESFHQSTPDRYVILERPQHPNGQLQVQPQVIRLAAPASDMRRHSTCDSSNYGSGPSYSPGDAFAQYQEVFPVNEFPDSNAVTYNHETNQIQSHCYAGSAHSAIQVTEDLLSPPQNVQSPYDWQHAPEVANAPSLPQFESTGQPVYHSPVEPCQSYLHVNNSPNVAIQHTEYIPHVQVDFGQYPKQEMQIAKGPEQSPLSTTMWSPYTKIEEQSPLKQEHQFFFPSDNTEKRSLTEQEKLDQRRIRNNESCRKSRRKRKIEKQEREARMSHLESENLQLRETIRDLEHQVRMERGKFNKINKL